MYFSVTVSPKSLTEINQEKEFFIMSKTTLFYIKMFSTLTPDQLEETRIGFLSESKRLTHKDFSPQIEAITYLQDFQARQVA